MRRPVHGFALAAAVLAAEAVAGDGAGRSGAWELDLPRGTLEAVGGAAAAPVAEGAAATTINPARLAGADRGSLVAGYTRLPLGLSDGQLAGAVGLGAAGALGGALRVLRAEVSGSLEDATGGYGGPGEPVRVQTVIGSAAWAPDLSRFDGALPAKVRAGVGLELARRAIAGPVTSGLGGSVAITAEWPDDLTGFAQARNIGWTDGVPWPVTVAAGGSWTRNGLLAAGDRLRAAVAGTWGPEGGAGGAVLVEFGASGERFGASARIGWRGSAVSSASLLPAAGFTLRASHLTLDAAWAPLGPFGWSTSLGLGWTTGPAGD